MQQVKEEIKKYHDSLKKLHEDEVFNKLESIPRLIKVIENTQLLLDKEGFELLLSLIQTQTSSKLVTNNIFISIRKEYHDFVLSLFRDFNNVNYLAGNDPLTGLFNTSMQHLQRIKNAISQISGILLTPLKPYFIEFIRNLNAHIFMMNKMREYNPHSLQIQEISNHLSFLSHCLAENDSEAIAYYFDLNNSDSTLHSLLHYFKKLKTASLPVFFFRFELSTPKIQVHSFATTILNAKELSFRLKKIDGINGEALTDLNNTCVNLYEKHIKRIEENLLKIEVFSKGDHPWFNKTKKDLNTLVKQLTSAEFHCKTFFPSPENDLIKAHLEIVRGKIQDIICAFNFTFPLIFANGAKPLYTIFYYDLLSTELTALKASLIDLYEKCLAKKHPLQISFHSIFMTFMENFGQDRSETVKVNIMKMFEITELSQQTSISSNTSNSNSSQQISNS